MSPNISFLFRIFMLCLVTVNIRALDIKNPSHILPISDGWKFSFYKDGNTDPISPDYDDTNWVKVSLPHTFTDHTFLQAYIDPETGSPLTPIEISYYEKRERLGWYRLTFTLETLPDEHALAVELGVIDNVDICYLNGKPVASTGDPFSDKEQFAYDKLRLYELPTQYLKPGKNVLVLLVKGYFSENQGGGPLFGPFNIGPLYRLQKIANINEFVKLSLIAVYLILFIYYFFLFIMQRKSPEFLFFSLFTLIIAFYLFGRNQLKYELFSLDAFYRLKKAEYFMLFSLVPIWFHFVEYLFKKKLLTVWTAIIDTISLILIMVILISTQIYFWDKMNRYFFSFIILFGVFYTLTVCIIGTVKGLIDARILLVSFLIFALSVVNDLLVSLVIIESIRTVQWGFLFIVIMTALILAARFQRLHKKIVVSNNNLHVLYDTSLSLNRLSATEAKVEDLSEIILGTATAFAHANRVSLMFLSDDKTTLSIMAATFPYDKKQDATLPVNPDTPAGWVITNKKPLLVPVSGNMKVSQPPQFRKTQSSFIVLPLFVKNDIFGCINISEKKDGTNFTEDDLALLSAFSSSVSITIENAFLYEDLVYQQEMEKEMELAHRIQTAILPANLSSDNFEIAGLMEPADNVGGDYYDYIVDPRGEEWFCIGDVTSHGLTPGLIMMMAQSIILSTILQGNNLSPTDVIIRTNTILFEVIKNRLDVDEHMTLCILHHKGNGKMEMAGKHEDLYIFRKTTKTLETIETDGLWIGIIPDIEEHTRMIEFNLNSDDVLIMYTDGVIEARNNNGKMYSPQRLKEAILKNSGLSSLGIITEIKNDVFSFSKNRDDDVTLLALRLK